MRFILSLLLLALAACGSATPFPSPPPLPSPTALAVATTASPRATPRATRTPARTPATTATATVTPAPTATPRLVVETGTLAPGFSLTTYAEVPAPASLTFGPDGRLYVASTNGAVYVVASAGEAPRVYAQNVPMPLGLLWVGQRLYISYRGSVAYVEDTDGDGVSDQRQTVLRNLPSFGLHQNDGLALGPDRFIYMGMGSTCDHCRESDARNGTIMRFRLDGTSAGVYASGLRNPYDLAFNAAGALFATDNSRDDLGPDQPPEELNHIRADGHYGWPECWLGNDAPLCAKRASPVAAFTAHTSANGLAFYHGQQFPEEYFDNAFVAVTGSIYMFPEDTERGIMRVRLAPEGDSYVSESEWFLELPDGRPVDLTVGPDGGLYVADYVAGAVYRIVYGAP